MRIVIFTHDLPYPPVHGGRIDMYNRLSTFRILGHSIFLISWAMFDDNSTEKSYNQISSIVNEHVCFRKAESKIRRLKKALTKLVKLPYQSTVVSQCSLSRKEFQELFERIRRFGADAVFVESIYAGKLAKRFANKENVPLFIRSHNVEHLYIKKQAVLASSFWIKFKFWAMGSNLRRYEMNMLRNADAFFDISKSDLEFWASIGIKNGYWMPPVYFDDASGTEELKATENFHIAFIGNLNSPNNVQGLIWFLERVLPHVQSRISGFRILIAGSNPSLEVIAFCSRIPSVKLLANPSNVSGLYERVQVLINPLLYGSGVNIKSVEMLHKAKAVVCTTIAVEGLNSEARRFFTIADQPDLFAEHIVGYLDGSKPISLADKNQALKYFSPSFMAESIEKMESICKSRKSSTKEGLLKG